MNSVIRGDIAQITAQAIPWQQLSGATILVTGASGFLPAYMIDTLLYLNDSVLTKPTRVVALVRDADRAHRRFPLYVGRHDFDLLVQDVCDPLTLPDQLDYIIHAASHASPRFYRVDPVGTLSPNVIGTHHLLNAARERSTRGFLFFSSGDVYGIPTDPAGRIGESDYGYLDPTDFRSCYGESKRMGETMCVAWAVQHGVPTKIVRPFHTYGPGMRLDDGRVFADFVHDILNGGPIVLHSDGTARRCFCYLADATAAFFTVLLQGVSGQAYNVANPNAECSIRELAECLASVFIGEKIAVERRGVVDFDYVPSPIPGTLPSVSKMETLGWTPSTSIPIGFRRTVESYRLDNIRS